MRKKIQNVGWPSGSAQSASGTANSLLSLTGSQLIKKLLHAFSCRRYSVILKNIISLALRLLQNFCNSFCSVFAPRMWKIEKNKIVLKNTPHVNFYNDASIIFVTAYKCVISQPQKQKDHSCTKKSNCSDTKKQRLRWFAFTN